MKKQISIGIAIIACVALCAAVWPRSVEGGKVPAGPDHGISEIDKHSGLPECSADRCAYHILS